MLNDTIVVLCCLFLLCLSRKTIPLQIFNVNYIYISLNTAKQDKTRSVFSYTITEQWYREKHHSNTFHIIYSVHTI